MAVLSERGETIMPLATDYVNKDGRPCAAQVTSPIPGEPLAASVEPELVHSILEKELAQKFLTLGGFAFFDDARPPNMVHCAVLTDYPSEDEAPIRSVANEGSQAYKIHEMPTKASPVTTSGSAVMHTSQASILSVLPAAECASMPEWKLRQLSQIPLDVPAEGSAAANVTRRGSETLKSTSDQPTQGRQVSTNLWPMGVGHGRVGNASAQPIPQLWPLAFSTGEHQS